MEDCEVCFRKCSSALHSIHPTHVSIAGQCKHSVSPSPWLSRKKKSSDIWWWSGLCLTCFIMQLNIFTVKFMFFAKGHYTKCAAASLLRTIVHTCRSMGVIHKDLSLIIFFCWTRMRILLSKPPISVYPSFTNKVLHFYLFLFESKI